MSQSMMEILLFLAQEFLFFLFDHFETTMASKSLLTVCFIMEACEHQPLIDFINCVFVIFDRRGWICGIRWS